MGKGRSVVIVPTIVILVIGVYYFYGWEIESRLNKDKTVYNVTELANLIEEQLDAGATGGTFYLSGVSQTELNSINEYITNMNGAVSQYSIQEKSKGGMKVLFKYEINDNYYVINKYLYNESIPSDRAQAVKLYEYVVELIESLIDDGMTDYEKELAIHDYIVRNCEYGYVDYSKDYAYKAYGCLVQNKAVCNGYAEAMSLLLTCTGIENTIVTGTGKGESHAWNQVCLEGDWYNVDATWDDPLPDRGSFVGHMYFNVTDDVMDDEHEWNEANSNSCTKTALNYFEQNNLVCDYNTAVIKIEEIAQNNPTATAELVLTDYDETKYVGFSFVCDNPGVSYFSYSKYEYGDNEIITLYLNQRE